MLLRCTQLSFSSESQFRCKTHHSAANANSLQETQFRQQITNSQQLTQLPQRLPNSLPNTHFGSESQIRNSQLKFDSDSQIHCKTHISIRCKQLSFGSKSQIRNSQLKFGSDSQIRCKTHISTAIANSLRIIQFQQRITIRCRQLNFGTHFGIEC